jgi:hypothetical protein
MALNGTRWRNRTTPYAAARHDWTGHGGDARQHQAGRLYVMALHWTDLYGTGRHDGTRHGPVAHSGWTRPYYMGRHDMT